MGKRQQLLPPYLEENPVWVGMMAALDEVWTDGTPSQDSLDKAIQFISKVRTLYLTNSTIDTKITNSTMVSFDDFDKPERKALISQAGMLGLQIGNASILSDDDYLVLVRNIASYWYEKGTGGFADFMSFCLGMELTLNTLWTEDYATFVAEADLPSGYSPVWNSGTWYPTTHIELSYDAGRFANVSTFDLAQFFYEFANYNLVLVGINESINIYFSTTTSVDTADIVMLCAWHDVEEFISNY